jgi:hypothetical protein
MEENNGYTVLFCIKKQGGEFAHWPHTMRFFCRSPAEESRTTTFGKHGIYGADL